MNEERFVSAINSGKMANRLAAAKEEIRRFVEARPNDRIGLVGFAVTNKIYSQNSNFVTNN